MTNVGILSFNAITKVFQSSISSSNYREQLESMKKEKQEMQSHMQQQASSILHFKAYCKSVVSYFIFSNLISWLLKCCGIVVIWVKISTTVFSDDKARGCGSDIRKRKTWSRTNLTKAGWRTSRANEITIGFFRNISWSQIKFGEKSWSP